MQLQLEICEDEGMLPPEYNTSSKKTNIQEHWLANEWEPE